MARVVHLTVVPHDPTLPAAAQGRVPDMVEGTRRTIEELDRLRRNLADARPDCIVMIGSDHLCSFFLDNMPPFLIGKAARLSGPPGYEVADWGLERYDVPVQGELARHILTAGYENDVDFAYSDEFVADHAITIPLNFMRPEQDLPVVPVFLNFLAPPLPPARRYHKVGQVVRRLIEEWDRPSRVAVVATGHMTNGVGGARMLDAMKRPESDWDQLIRDLIVRNDIDGVIRHAGWDEMYAQGNNTPGFLGFVFALGMAGGVPFSWHDYIPSTRNPLNLMLEWNEAHLNGEVA